jgi:hypothetical protein
MCLCMLPVLFSDYHRRGTDVFGLLIPHFLERIECSNGKSSIRKVAYIKTQSAEPCKLFQIFLHDDASHGLHALGRAIRKTCVKQIPPSVASPLVSPVMTRRLAVLRAIFTITPTRSHGTASASLYFGQFSASESFPWTKAVASRN